MMKKRCSVCGKEIDAVNEGYVKILDNFLQIKYFDTDEENCFCSDECMAKSLSAETVYEEE